MPSTIADWSALTSQNERLVTANEAASFATSQMAGIGSAVLDVQAHDLNAAAQAALPAAS